MKPQSLKLAGTISLIILSYFPVTQAADQPIEIVITAGRKAQTVNETLAPVSVITRADIQRWQATDVPDVLRRIPSLTVVDTGGVISVRLRGTNSNHVLVLVDGVKVGAATVGTTAFEFLPLHQIERIEVVRGPRSSLYGSEAIGGVIQIFTRRDAARGFKPSVSISAGTQKTQKLNVNLAGGNGKTWYNFNAGTEKTGGIDVGQGPWVVVEEPDKDGLKNRNMSLRAGHRFAQGATVEASTLQARGDQKFDGFENEGKFVQQVSSIKGSVPVGSRTTLSAQVGQALDKRDSLKDGVFSSRFNTKRDSTTVQADMRVGAAGKATVGVDQIKDQVTSSTLFTVSSRKNDGLFGSYQTQWGKNNVEVAARHDKNQQFGRSNTGSIAVGRDLTANTRLTASYGTAFKAPTFNDVYWPLDYGYAGNPNLKPEKSRSVEIGLQGNNEKARWSLQAFNTEIKDLISTDEFFTTTININKARIQGLEAGVTSTVGGWSVGANATLQNAKNLSGTDNSKRLRHRPKSQLKIDADRSLGRGSVGASVLAVSKRFEDTANTQVLAGYTTLDLRAQYPLAKGLSLGVKLGNVLDKRYQTALGYNQVGRNGLVTLTYSPK